MSLFGSVKNQLNRLRTGISEVFDGFMSGITGIGTAKDKARTYRYVPKLRMNHFQLDCAYSELAFVKKIINMLPDAAISKGIDINHDRAKEIIKILNNLNAHTPFKGLSWLSAQHGKMSRLHGGAVIWWDVDDGGNQDQELNLNNIRAFNGGTVVDSGYCWPVDPFAGINAQQYWIYGFNGQPPVMVHVSRLSIDHNTSASPQSLLNNNGWPESLLFTCWDSLTELISGYMKVGTILEDFITGEYYVDGLNDMMIDPADKAWQNKLSSQVEAAGIVNALVMDAKDKYNKQTTNLSNLPESIGVLERRFAAESDTPYGKIFGEYSGNALSNSGDSQNRDWDNKICAYQDAHLKAPISRALEFVAAMLKINEEISFDFNPQALPTPKEQAEVYKLVSEGDKANIESGALLPEECSNSHYGGAEFSLQIQLDPALRAKRETEKKEAALKMEQQLNSNNNNELNNKENNDPEKETPEDE